MKVLLLVLVLALCAAAYYCVSGGSGKKASGNDKKTGKAAQLKEEVGGVINYGTGALPLRTGKNMEQRIQEAQEAHDRQLQEAMEY